jgi:hypothetical protein
MVRDGLLRSLKTSADRAYATKTSAKTPSRQGRPNPSLGVHQFFK